MTSCVSKKKFDALQSDKDALESSLAEVKEQVNNLETQNQTLNTEKESLSQEISSVKSDLDNTKTQLSTVEASVSEKQTQIDALKTEISSVFDDVDKTMSDNNMRLNEMEDMLYVDMDGVNFKSGSARVSTDDKETLDKLATLLKSNPSLHFIVEGHTDKRAISNARYKDNWDLSAARSIAVVRELVDMGVSPNQLTAAGRGEHAPKVDGESSDELAENRRTEVIVLPKLGKLYKYHSGT